MVVSKKQKTEAVPQKEEQTKLRQYEVIVILGPDLSIGQVRDSIKVLENTILEQEGKIEGTEYWGFRSTAYPIKKRSKAHYVYLGVTLHPFALKELDYCLRVKLRQEVVRFLVIECSEEGLVFPTPLFHSSLTDAVAGGYQSDEDQPADNPLRVKDTGAEASFKETVAGEK